jgi:hypothetical protein
MTRCFFAAGAARRLLKLRTQERQARVLRVRVSFAAFRDVAPASEVPVTVRTIAKCLPSGLLSGACALALPAFFAIGCAGYATVDGYDATYVDPPPPAVVAYPSYRVRDGYVYEGQGRYYHMHSGRWVTYRSLPREAVRVKVEGRTNVQRR